MPLDIAAAGEHAALGLPELPSDPLKVQQLKGRVREAVRFRDKPVFRAEPAQLGVGHYPLHEIAALRAVRQVDHPGQGDGVAQRAPLHCRQPLKDRHLRFAQPRKLLGQGVQLGQGTIVLVHVQENVSGAKRAEKLPSGRAAVRQLQIFQRVQQGVGRGGEVQLRAAVLRCQFHLKHLTQGSSPRSGAGPRPAGRPWGRRRGSPSRANSRPPSPAPGPR